MYICIFVLYTDFVNKERMNESKPKKSVSLNDISKYIPTHIKQNDNDFLLN